MADLNEFIKHLEWVFRTQKPEYKDYKGAGTKYYYWGSKNDDTSSR